MVKKKSKKKGESPEDRKFRLKQEAELLAHNEKQARIKSREKAVQEHMKAKNRGLRRLKDAKRNYGRTIGLEEVVKGTDGRWQARTVSFLIGD